jgi:hypothetical protein
MKLVRPEFDSTITKQRAAVLEALDKLFDLEVPRRSIRPMLRLVSPLEDELGAGEPVGEELRAFLIRRGWDIWTVGAELELFKAVRHVMTARPDRQRWNRAVLSTLWADIGSHDREIA